MKEFLIFLLVLSFIENTTKVTKPSTKQIVNKNTNKKSINKLIEIQNKQKKNPNRKLLEGIIEKLKKKH